MRNIFIHLSSLTLIRNNIHVFKVFGCSSPLFLQWKLNDKIMEYCTGSQPLVSFCNFLFLKSLFFKIIWISEEPSKTFKHCCPPLPLSLLLSWTWPWRRRWQVSGWRFPVWTSWAAVTIKTPVMSWTSWSLRVRTVLNHCTPTACPVAAPSKLWVFLLLRQMNVCFHASHQ